MNSTITGSIGETSGKRRLRRATALTGGLLTCCTLVWQSSYAAFFDTTDNPGNTLGAGTVQLDDNDSGSILFNAETNLAPGAQRSACIGVTYTGSLPPTSIAMYFPNGPTQARESESGAAYTDWNHLAGPEMDDNITLHVEATDTDLPTHTYGTCPPTGYTTILTANLRQLINNNNTFTTGITVPTIARTMYRVFRITYTFDTTAPNTAQNDGIEFTITWEAQK